MLEFKNLTKASVNYFSFDKIAKRIFKEEGVNGKTEISVVFVTPEQIKDLNKKYRQKDEATDVLSFHVKEEGAHKKQQPNSNFVFPVKNLLVLGEIVICPQFIKNTCLVKKEDLKKSLERVFVHGMLHLLGYDHIRPKDRAIMKEKEDRYLGLKTI